MIGSVRGPSDSSVCRSRVACVACPASPIFGHPALLACALMLAWAAGWVPDSRLQGQGTPSSAPTPISYQGRLVDNGSAANGSYDFEFALMDAAVAGNAVGQPVQATLNVVGGVFTTPLAFPPEHFDGSPRWIEVRVRATAASGERAVLERQPVHYTPYAVRALRAATVASVPVQSLPEAVPLKNGDGKLDSALLGAEIARTTDVAALSQALATTQAQLAALAADHALLRQTLSNSLAGVRPGLTVASLEASDAALVATGFQKAFSTTASPWTATSADAAPSARAEATAVWTGQDWWIWGGRGSGQVVLANGARYTPSMDTWADITTLDAPEGRYAHTAVWTGDRMLVWGGYGATSLNTGGRLSRGASAWQSVTTQGAPSARHAHGAAWTGRFMVVFGGRNNGGLLNTGGYYDPATDQWGGLPTVGAPTARSMATVLWTGSGLLVWGGETAEGGDATGALLTFGADGLPGAWVALPTLPGFAGRSAHAWAWDGQRLLVWGGRNASRQSMADGAVLDVSAGSWTRMSTQGAPGARQFAGGVWTGAEFLVLGGSDVSGALAGGHAWRPAGDLWRALPAGAPAVGRTGSHYGWTGTEVLAFGGQGNVASAPIGQPQRLDPRPPWHFYTQVPR